MVSSELSHLKESRKIAIQSSPLFDRRLSLSHDELTLVFGQYWHLLTYFPDFLARLITVLPSLEDKSSVARVLSEELGNGNLEEAHEGAYFEALKLLKIDENSVRSSIPLPKTQAMMNGYYTCANQAHQALGFFLSTEFADLWIVSNLGRLMLNALPERQKIKWIDLHVTQEPGHVSDADHCLGSVIHADDQSQVLAQAHECARLWDDFFLGIYEEIIAGRRKLADAV